MTAKGLNTMLSQQYYRYYSFLVSVSKLIREKECPLNNPPRKEKTCIFCKSVAITFFLHQKIKHNDFRGEK